jgi:MerR family transcriptional regulator, heat shock protein HspR
MSTSRPAGLFLIGTAAELAGMHPQTLRVYERRGLITPQRTLGNTRIYSEADVLLLRRIQELSEQGLNLAGVERVLDLEQRLERTERRVRDLTAELDEVRAENRAALAEARAGRGQLVPAPRRPSHLVPTYRRVVDQRAWTMRRTV